MNISKKDIERRIDSRNPYSGFVFFATNSHFFEGELLNFSRHGLFIKTYEVLGLGEFITVALPYVKEKQRKVRGQILWRNHEGYGIELVKRRNDNNFQFLKLKAKLRS